MKISDLIKLVDKLSVEEITIIWNDGVAVISPLDPPSGLHIYDKYDIEKIWNSENGRGISVLLNKCRSEVSNNG